MRRSLLITLGVFFAAAGIVYALNSDPQLLAKFEAEERQYGLPTGILAKIANAESRGRTCVPNLAGRSSALGLFQYTRGTWLDATRALYGSPRELELRCNRFVATEVTAWALQRFRGSNLSLIRQSGANEMAALYLSHFLGHGGARRFLQLLTSNPDDSASRWFPTEAGSNPEAFNGRSIRGLHNWAADKMRQPGITGSDFTGTYDGPTTGRLIDSAGMLGLSRPYTGQYPLPNTTFSYPTTFTNADLNPPSQPNNMPATGFTSQQISSGTERAAVIIVQPRTVRRGDSVLVSWTSVGMQPNSCEIKAQGVSYTQGQSEGSQRFTAPTAAGTVEFVLTCTDKQGSSVGSQTFLTVQ